MKKYKCWFEKRLLAGAILISVLNIQAWASNVHLVLDLDHTLVESVSFDNKKVANVPENRLFTLPAGKETHKYIIYAGVPEFLLLCKKKKFKISFFSNASKTRNQPLVSHLLSLAFGASESKRTQDEYKIYSLEDGIVNTRQMSSEAAEAYQPEKPKNCLNNCFGGSNKKDLSILEKDSKISLDSTILVDDDPSYVVRGQEANLLSVNRNHQIDWNLERGMLAGNKIVRLTGMLLEAERRFGEKQYPSIVQALKSIQYDSNKEAYLYGELDQPLFYSVGFEALKAISSTFELFSTQSESGDIYSISTVFPENGGKAGSDRAGDSKSGTPMEIDKSES